MNYRFYLAPLALPFTLLLVWSALLHPGSAVADAVPPPPEKCPKGLIGITSHSGPECVKPAPKNCPAGWRPEIRGICRLDSCQSDENCQDGKQCLEADLCLQEFIQEWEYGQADPPRNRPLFAGPPMRLDPPRRRIQAVDVCGNGKACAGTAKCGKAKVCLPKGVTRPGTWTPPSDAGKAVIRPPT